MLSEHAARNVQLLGSSDALVRRTANRPMTLFTSRLERRLWLSTLAALVAIFASLGRAPEWAAALRSGGLLEAVFLGAFSIAVVAVLLVALAVRPGGRQLAVGLSIVAVYAAAFARIQILEERTHLFEFGIVGVLIYLALTERRANGRGVRSPAAWAVLATGVLGWVDEGIQAVLPGRVYDLRDVGTNALAGLLAVTATVALRWARSR